MHLSLPTRHKSRKDALTLAIMPSPGLPAGRAAFSTYSLCITAACREVGLRDVCAIAGKVLA